MSELRRLIENRLRLLESRVRPLLARRSVLRDELDEVQAEVHSLLPELQEATAAAQAIGIVPSEHFDVRDTQNSSDETAESNGVTIKQAIRLTLNSVRSGLNSQDLLGYINRDHWDGKLDRTSFSPQLSRMKKDGEVDLTAGIYTITDKGRAVGGLPRHRERLQAVSQENGARGVAPPSAPEAGSHKDLLG